MHQPRTDLILHFLHGINANLFTIKSKPINGTSKLSAVVQKILSQSVTHYSLPFTSSSPIRKEQRKNEKSSKNLAFSLRLGHGRRRSNSSRRCRLHSRALSPLPFAVAATTAAGAAAHRRLHFRRPSPVLHPRRSPVTAATASGGAAASTHSSSGGNCVE